MDYINVIIRYGIMAALLIALIFGVRIAARHGNSTVAPHDYRDMREVPRYSTVSFDGSLSMGDYRVGDLVVISLGDQSSTDTFFAWVAATPGDALEIRDGAFYSNEQAVATIVDQRRNNPGNIGIIGNGLNDVAPVSVPSHHFYLVSDGHRHDSVIHGLFPMSAIAGRVMKVSGGLD